MRFLFTLFISTCFHFSNAQVSGLIYNEEGETLAFANVFLLQAKDSSFVKGTITTMDGSFVFEEVAMGDYFLRLSMLAYQTMDVEKFAIEKGGSKFFEHLRLKAAAFDLESVEVRAKRMLFEQTMEGTTVNVQSSLLTQGSSALQVLERSPGVIIDHRNGGFSLNGQSGTLVMINGKRVRMSEGEVINLLTGMSADNIQKIELLTNPSARYDAEGTAGIINIVLKKGEGQGTNGSIALSLGYGWGQKENLTASLNHRKESINYYASYSFSNDETFWDWNGVGTNTLRAFGGNSSTTFGSETVRKNRAHNLLAGFEKTLLEDITFGASIHGNTSVVKSDVFNKSSYYLNADSALHTHVHVAGDGRWDNLTTSVFLEKQKERSKFSLDIDHLYYHNKNPNRAISTFRNKEQEIVYPAGAIYANEHRGRSNTDINIGVLKFDFEQDFKEDWRLETGLKVSYSVTMNSGAIEREEGGLWVLDDRNRSKTEIIEKIGAAYFTAQYAMDEKTTFKAGARYEYWDRNFSDDALDKRFGKLFPSIFLSRQLSSSTSLTIAYNKRITRPNYNDLASFLVYNDPISVFTGNPLLKPAISNNLNLSFQVGGNHLGLRYSEEQNPIARYQLVENEQSDLIIVAPQNVAYQKSLALQMNIPWEVRSWWTMNVGGSFAGRRFLLQHTREAVRKDYLFFDLNGSQTFQLPRGFDLELSGWYISDHFNGSVQVEGFGMLNAGLKKTLKNNQGSLQFTVTDLLKSMNIITYFGQLTEEAFGVESRIHFQPESTNARIFKLSYFRSFGNTKVKGRKERSRGVSEEQSRISID